MPLFSQSLEYSKHDSKRETLVKERVRSMFNMDMEGLCKVFLAESGCKSSWESLTTFERDEWERKVERAWGRAVDRQLKLARRSSNIKRETSIMGSQDHQIAI